MMQLFSYQQEDIDRVIAEGHKSVYFAYEPALGKTLTAVALAHRWEAGSKVVVAPRNTLRGWERTILDQDPDAKIYRLENTTKGHKAGGFLRLAEGATAWYLITWELMRTGVITGSQPDLIIADEVHRIQNYGRSLTSNTFRYFTSEYKIALSGTPAGNRPEGLFSPINWLWPKRYKSYHKWIENFWRTIRNGSIIQLVRELVPGGVVADLPCFVRRRKADHRGDLPPVLPDIELTAPMTRAQRKIYKQFEDAALAWLGDHPVAASIPLVMDLRMRQVTLGEPIVNEDGKVDFDLNCKSAKIEELITLIKDNPEDETFFVLSPSAAFIPVVVHRLNEAGIKAEAYFGDTKQKERDRLVDELGHTYRVLVAGIAAVAEGLDGLQHKCSTGVWLAKHSNAMLNTQARERLDRPGQKDSVQWYNLIAPDTKDEATEERLDDIAQSLASMIDYA